MNNVFYGDYKTAFNEAVTDLIAENIEDRGERILAVHALTDAYVDSVGETPDDKQLERLTDYILREEITDPDPYKVEHNEYPIMSDIQLNRRSSGRRGTSGTNMRGETPIRTDDDCNSNHARVGVHLASDGRDYRSPIRRTRSVSELIFVDQHAKIRNTERAAQYKRDTSPGAVVPYNLRDTGGELAPEFVQCRTITYTPIPEYYR